MSCAPFRRRLPASAGLRPTSCSRSGAVSAERRAQYAADEIAARLQHPFKTEIVRRGVAVELGAGHVTFLDAKRVQGVEPVRAEAEGLAGFEDRFPESERVHRWNRKLVGELAGERNAEQAARDAGNCCVRRLP